MNKLFVVIPMILIIVAIIFTAVPMSFDSETLAATLPITIGAIICIILGEVLIAVRGSKK